MRQAQRLAAFATQLRKEYVSAVLVASAAFIFAPSDAQAVMRGHVAVTISKHVVKLVDHNFLGTATVIGRQHLLAANRGVGGSGPFFVVVGGPRIAVPDRKSTLNSSPPS